MESEEQMTAIGIGVSDREPVTFFDYKPRPMSKAEKIYRRALADFEEAKDRERQAIDFWIDMRTQFGDNSPQANNAEIAMMKCQELADDAEAKKHDAWVKMNCPHTHVKPIKTIEGEQAQVCILCGAIEDEFHAHIIPDITASER